MKKIIIYLILAVFLNSSFVPYSRGYAATLSIEDMVLPQPGQRVSLSQAFMPVMLKGVVVDPKDPFKFNFIVDSGDTGLKIEQLNEQGMKLVKYFLAALTVPEDEMWVNLSPYEKDRVISKSFGSTEMGRDLLAQDYLLKQLSASLTYPEETLGKKFWDQVYKRINDQYGNVTNVNIPTNTFNKVWIMPDKAQVYEHKNGAFVVEGKLKVMLEEDYLAVSKNQRQTGDISPSEMCPQAGCQAKSGMHAKAPQGNYRMRTVPSQIIREIILPQLEIEVNQGEHFTSLRQAYQSMILASWYKIRLKESIIGKLYVNQGKTDGVTLKDETANQKIYEQYVEAYKKGVYNYIKDTPDVKGQILPKKYFSGGLVIKTESLVGASLKHQNAAMRAQVLRSKGNVASLLVNTTPSMSEKFRLLDTVKNISGGQDSIYGKTIRMTDVDKEEIRRLISISDKKERWAYKDAKPLLDALKTIKNGRTVQVFYADHDGVVSGVMFVFRGRTQRDEHIILGSRGADIEIIKLLKNTHEGLKDSAMVEIVDHADFKRQLNDAFNRFRELDLVDRVSEQSQNIKQEIADIIQEMVEEILHSHRKYPRTYLEVIVTEDMNGQSDFPKFKIIIKNREGMHDGIEFNGSTMENYYHNLHVLLKGSKYSKPLLNGMVIIDEASPKDLEHATRGMRSEHDWQIDFTVGFKDSAMNVATFGGLSAMNFRHLVPFSDDLFDFFMSLTAKYRVFLMSQELNDNVDSFKQYLSDVKGLNWLDQVFENHIDQALDKLTSHAWSSKVVSIHSKVKAQIMEEIAVNDLIDFLDSDESFWSDGVLFITIKKEAEQLALDHNNQVNLQSLTVRVKEILMQGIYRDLFEESLDEHLGEFINDAAMQTYLTAQGEKNLGGIDLNAKNLDLLIKRDANGIILPVSSQPMDQIHINGLFPVILSISAVQNLHDFLN